MGNSAEYDNLPLPAWAGPLGTTTTVGKEIIKREREDGRVIGFPRPVDMSIRKFKKHLKEKFTNLTSREYFELVKQYKERAWRDYHDMVRDLGNYPSHPVTKDENGKQS